MVAPRWSSLDLTPPAFAEGLCDWSRGDGAPSYEDDAVARIACGDPDLGTCLELRIAEPVQRLRYMGEMPIRRGVRVALRVRLKALRGPRLVARIAASPGGRGGQGVGGLPTAGRTAALGAHGRVTTIRAIIGRVAAPGVDLVWDARALYAHVGLDVVGPRGGVVRIEDLQVWEIRDEIAEVWGGLPGFAPGADGPAAAM